MTEWQIIVGFVVAGGVVLGAIWKIFDGRITALEQTNITKDVHEEAFKRVDQYMASTDKRLDRIEDTRPTTGEIAAKLEAKVAQKSIPLAHR